MQVVQTQLRSSFRRFPTRPLALVFVLVAALLAALLVAGTAVYWHRSTAQPASISVAGTGPTHSDARNDEGALTVPGTGGSDIHVLQPERFRIGGPQ